MKQETENLIGKVLSIDQMQISRAEGALQKVVPAVERIINEYAALQSLPPFNQKVWENILSDNGKSVEERYLKQAESDLQQFKNASFVAGIMHNVDEALNPLKIAIKAARKTLSDAAFNQIYGVLDISLQDIRIEKGSHVIDLTRVTEVYTLRIENEPQAALYMAGIAAQKAMERLRELLQDTDSDVKRIGWGCSPASEGVFTYYIETGKLEFDLSHVSSAKQMELVE